MTNLGGSIGATTGGDRQPDVSGVTGEQLVAYAKKFVGVPYVAGGRGPKGWDCAGFTWYVAQHFNIDIPQISEGQLTSGSKVDGLQNVLPGDLIVLRRKGTQGVGGDGHVMMATHGRNVIHAHGGVGGTTNIQSVNVAIPGDHYIAGIRRIAQTGGIGSVGSTVPDSSSVPATPGSFELAKKFIKPNRLKDGVIFNPPQPNKKLFRLSEYPNPRGFIVRDPAVQTNFGSGGKWQTFQSNFGFRFSYNPTTFAESYSAPTTGDPVQMLVDSAQGRPLLTGDGSGGQVTFNLLLSRFEDQWYLKQPNWTDFYPAGSITPEQRIDILERGTQSDIEYLFRLCNGDPQDTWHGMTSDWGMLIPMPAIISFGDQKGVRRVRGYIESVGWSHKILAAGMIPMYSEVSVVFNRLPDSYYDTTNGTSSTSSVNSSNQHYSTGNKKTDGKTTTADIGPVMATARDMVGKYSRSLMVGPDPDPANGVDDAGYVWHVFDFTIPNSAGAQYNGRSALMKLGKTVETQNMKVGDVVFFGKGKDPSTASHVGILSGDGMLLHVSNDKNIKQPVEEPVADVVTKMKLNKQPMVVRRFVESN